MKYLAGIGLITVALLLVVTVAFAQVWVRPHVRRDGTVVEGHWRSSPNSSRQDNWSTRGNVNPFTGEEGGRDPGDADTRAIRPLQMPRLRQLPRLPQLPRLRQLYDEDKESEASDE